MISNPRREYLLKQLRGKDHRLAFRAIPELRRLDDGSLANIVSGYKAKDEQREFQFLVARIVLDKGIAGLVEKWTELPSPDWRQRLISEIGQFLDAWIEESLIDLLIRALNDPHEKVGGQAVVVLRAGLQELSPKALKSLAKTDIGKASLQMKENVQKWATPRRRAQITEALVAALARHSGNPKGLTWVEWYVDLLGYTANKSDQLAIELVEKLLPLSGEPRRVEYQKLDPSNLPWPTNVLAEKKGVPPGTPMTRIAYIATGLLDIAVIETALKRIRSRESE
jgi:hypothetical protein